MLALLLLLTTGPVATPPSGPKPPSPAKARKGGKPDVFTNPDWVRLPSYDDIEAFYPPQAMKTGLEGRAVITCQVAIDETLYSCAVVSETPPGAGFGAAAVAMATRFRMKPQLRNGVPQDGAWVVIPLSFKVSGNFAGSDLGKSERCLGYAQAGLDLAPTEMARRSYGYWNLVFTAGAVQANIKPSEMLRRREAARLEADKRLETPDGRSDAANCDELMRARTGLGGPAQ